MSVRKRAPIRLVIAFTAIPTLYLAFASGCGLEKPSSSSSVDRTVAYGDKLDTAINDFKQETKVLQTRMTVAAKAIPPKPSGKTSRAQMKSSAKSFKTLWDKAEKSYVRLRIKYAAIGEKAKAFFEQLALLEARLSSPETRARAAGRNKDLKERFTRQFVATGEALDKLKRVLGTGNDVVIMMLIGSLTAVLERDIQRLHAMDSEVQDIISSLKSSSSAFEEMFAPVLRS